MIVISMIVISMVVISMVPIKDWKSSGDIFCDNNIFGAAEDPYFDIRNSRNK